jgi:hypothetical protein
LKEFSCSEDLASSRSRRTNRNPSCSTRATSLPRCWPNVERAPPTSLSGFRLLRRRLREPRVDLADEGPDLFLERLRRMRDLPAWELRSAWSSASPVAIALSPHVLVALGDGIWSVVGGPCAHDDGSNK